MMKKTLFVTVVGALLLSLTACKTHYRLTDVSRTRILVDSRYDAHPDAQAAQFLAPYKEKVDEVMAPVVGHAAHDMASSRPESDLSNLLPDIFMWAAQHYGERADFAVYNMGGIRAALSKGAVTYGDVLDVAPFENKICFLTLKGDKVLELFHQIARRGGEGVSHGVELAITADGQLLSARLNGQDIDPAASYRVTTIDYLAEGNDGMTAFKSATDLHAPQDEKHNARFVIMDYFKAMEAQHIAVSSKTEGRITIK